MNTKHYVTSVAYNKIVPTLLSRETYVINEAFNPNYSISSMFQIVVLAVVCPLGCSQQSETQKRALYSVHDVRGCLKNNFASSIEPVERVFGVVLLN